MKLGLMPHIPSFINKNVYEKYGMYYENFKIASDFEIFLRYLCKKTKIYKIK